MECLAHRDSLYAFRARAFAFLCYVKMSNEMRKVTRNSVELCLVSDKRKQPQLEFSPLARVSQ